MKHLFISFRMVEEILNTRLMVKKAMKEHKNDKVRNALGRGWSKMSIYFQCHILSW